MVRQQCPGFCPEAVLLKVVTLNGLYGTNVYATLRMANHIVRVMAEAGQADWDPALVERLTAVLKALGVT